MHKDFFGNEIEIGDIVLRNCNGTQYVAQVITLTKKSIGLTRYKWQNKSTWDSVNHKWIYHKDDKPLYVTYFSGINLSKLDNSKIQETINNFI